MSHASQNVLAQILAYMANADNEARSAEVVNYQGSGAAKLRRDLAYKVARVAMRKRKERKQK